MFLGAAATYNAFNYFHPIRLKPKHFQIATPSKEVFEEKPFVILVMSYNNENYVEQNIKSILAQNYQNYRVLYFDDASSDNTFEKVKHYTKESKERFSLFKNPKNRGAMANHWHAIQMCEDDEIVVVLDGDDHFPHKEVLSRLNHYYQNPDVWLTHSRHIEYTDHRQGICSKPLKKQVIQKGTIRKEPWQTSHLRSFYAGLSKQIKLQDIIHDNRFFPTTYDLGCMIPMVEMAKEHTFFIPENLYMYNFVNPLSDARVHTDSQNFYDRHIRNLPSYTPISHYKKKKKANAADLVIFSYDRPLQLYALLESIEKQVQGLNQTTIIYRASDERFLASYREIIKEFPSHKYIKQPDQFCKESFKPLVMETLCSMKAPYLLFAVDDIIVKDHIDLITCIDAMEKTAAYGFYLRLGESTNYCYASDQDQGIPNLMPIFDSVKTWQFYKGKEDWNYPNSVDMTLFRKKEVYNALKTFSFHNPAELEAKWAARSDHTLLGLCFQESKIVNLPMNIVSQTFENRRENSYSTQELLVKFESGLKMDIAPLYQIKNKSAHIDYLPSFIEKASKSR